MNAEEIRWNAYKILVATQDKYGEFGRNCSEIIHSENNLRHPTGERNDKAMLLYKPNCSVTLIAALGISCYKGIKDNAVVAARQWFTESDYICNGWFCQKVQVVDENPFGKSKLQASKVTDIRHTATALLAALYFDAPVTFISDALRNLISNKCRDCNHKGWKAALEAKESQTDFYTTVYMLASLYSLKSLNIFQSYGIEKMQINQLLRNGLDALCSDPPWRLGYNSLVEQTLRANGTLLFFLAEFLSESYPEYLEESVNFIIENVQENGDNVCWLNGDFDVTVNILAGLLMAETKMPQNKKLKRIIKKSKNYIEQTFEKLKSYHPVSLGFLLYIYSNRTTYYPLLSNEVLVMNKYMQKVDVLMMVATEEEEKAITKYEDFSQYQLKDGTIVLWKEIDNIKLVLARGYDYGEVSSVIMAERLYVEFKPKIIVMAGFCAGQKGKQLLGDVVIAEKVFNYDLGKQVAQNVVQPQICSYMIDGQIKQEIERFGDTWRNSIKPELPKDFDIQCFEFLRTLEQYKKGANPMKLFDNEKYPNWREMIERLLADGYIGKIRNGEKIVLRSEGKQYLNNLLLMNPEGLVPKEPKAMLGVLATGTKVQQWDGIFNYLNTQYDRKCSVLDMEGRAMAELARFNGCPFIIAKGVGDFAQNGKAFANRFIDYAVYSSYAFLIALLREYLGEN